MDSIRVSKLYRHTVGVTGFASADGTMLPGAMTSPLTPGTPRGAMNELRNGVKRPASPSSSRSGAADSLALVFNSVSEPHAGRRMESLETLPVRAPDHEAVSQ